MGSFEVRETADRGFGVFARRRYGADEVVFYEEPVFVRAPVSQTLPAKLWHQIASILEETGDPPEAAELVWDFSVRFCEADAKTREAVLRLHHPPLDDPMIKVQQAMRIVSVCWLGLKRKNCSLEDLQRAVLVDLYNNFDGALFSTGCRLNHSCAPALQHSDYGQISVNGKSERAAYACWNELLDFRKSVVGDTSLLSQNHINGCVALAAMPETSSKSLVSLARMAEAQGAIALVAVAPRKPLSRCMQSRWAQPSNANRCPGIPAFVMESLPDLGVPFAAEVSAGKEFRTTCDIKCGEELTISYLGGHANELGVEERRAYLQGAYGFLCRCGLCEKRSTRKNNVKVRHRCLARGASHRRLRRLVVASRFIRNTKHSRK